MKTRLRYPIGHSQIALALCCLVAAGGCVTAPPVKQLFTPVILKAAYTREPVKMDGSLDDQVWRTAAVYQLSLAKGETSPTELGDVQLAWNERYFYVAVRFDDSDIVAEGKEDQLQHFRLGDTVELFLKPNGCTWYWELHATPSGRKSSFWLPGRGRLGLASGRQYQCGLRVAARINGTINNWQDKDRHWIAEMAIPVEDLTAHGQTFQPGSDWRILIGRYNYSRYLPRKELSMCPNLSRTDFHLHEEYGILELAH